MNTKLIESLVQIIQTLSEEEQLLIKAKLFSNIPYPSTAEIAQLAQIGGAFQFLHDEPDIYTLEDGEPI
ncbi:MULTISPECIES: hypothetical protein [unclassified Microcoleus]|uniref:hypothetical protein n=1 Tax=unclassified Microcoleus TaxID=2642155 RepID=UPI0025DD0FD1|nr:MULTISPECIES: hypothetical protein [unclassified Microcoleus]